MPYNKAMQCPVCKQEMKKVRWHISYNPAENNKEYDYTTYQCADDDVWVNTEIPKTEPK